MSLQNGLRNAETLRGHLPRNHVVDGIVDFNVIMRDRAVFQRATSGPLTLETKGEPKHQRWVNALPTAGFEVVEVEFLNGEIVALARANSRDAPLNRRIVELVHEAERAGAGSPHLDANTLLALIR